MTTKWDDEEFDPEPDNNFLWAVALGVMVLIVAFAGVYTWGHHNSEIQWIAHMDDTFDSLTATEARVDTLEARWNALDPFCKSCTVRQTFPWQPGDSMWVTAMCGPEMEVEE